MVQQRLDTQVKTLLNQFVAYLELVHDETLSPRSVAVATYASAGHLRVQSARVITLRSLTVSSTNLYLISLPRGIL